MALRVTDWEYYRKIDEYQPFIDGYQVKLTIWTGNCGKDNTFTGNLDLDSYTNREGKEGEGLWWDIAFGDGSDPSSCNELDYWIEETGTDSGDDYAIVWIELNSTVASNNSFYVFYESDTATDYSNGDNTFSDLFDDFLDSGHTGWTEIVENSIKTGGGSHSYIVIDDLEQSKVRSTDKKTSQGIMLEVRAKFEADDSKMSSICCMCSDSGGAFDTGDVFGYASNQYWSHEYLYHLKNGDTSHNKTEWGSDDCDQSIYHIYGAGNTGSEVSCHTDGVEKETNSTYVADDSTMYIIFKANDHELMVDWVRIRKYASTEPSYATFNSETEIEGGVSYIDSGLRIYDGNELIKIGELETPTSDDILYVWNGTRYIRPALVSTNDSNASSVYIWVGNKYLCIAKI